MKKDYAALPPNAIIEKTVKALNDNNIQTIVTETSKEAKEKVLSLLPFNSQVMTATSTTLDQMDLTNEINDSGNYVSVKGELTKLNRETDHLKMQQLGAAPEYVIGSVHAVTEDGKVIVASGSGSQLPAYSYGASHVIWVVSTKKIVTNIEEGFERINKHILPLEDKRMKQVYGPEAGSSPRKILIFNAELNPNRITLIFVKEDLGF